MKICSGSELIEPDGLKLVWLTIVVFLVLYYIQTQTAFGTRVFAVGGNREDLDFSNGRQGRRARGGHGAARDHAVAKPEQESKAGSRGHQCRGPATPTALPP